MNVHNIQPPEDYVYAHVDIVGFSEFVNSSVGSLVIEAFVETVRSYNEKVRRMNQSVGGGYEIIVRSFGDTISTFFKCGIHDAPLTYVLIGLVRDVQKDLLMKHNFFLGGGIARGSMHPEVPTGEVMVLASNLEKNKTWFGVAVSDKIFKIVSNMARILVRPAPGSNDLVDTAFIKCEGVRYVDYLRLKVPGEETPDAALHDVVKEHRTALVSTLHRYKCLLDGSDVPPEKKRQAMKRYSVTLRYHNYVCSRLSLADDMTITDSPLTGLDIDTEILDVGNVFNF
ncbi:MAG: hypothetical protein LBS92_00990 [Candidatus Methanoplasma sp.]|jgi:hypothetical protein|nr:hypothetical protein [Candidatus Methanoplasma sp.]